MVSYQNQTKQDEYSLLLFPADEVKDEPLDQTDDVIREQQGKRKTDVSDMNENDNVFCFLTLVNLQKINFRFSIPNILKKVFTQE